MDTYSNFKKPGKNKFRVPGRTADKVLEIDLFLKFLTVTVDSKCIFFDTVTKGGQVPLNSMTAQDRVKNLLKNLEFLVTVTVSLLVPTIFS